MTKITQRQLGMVLDMIDARVDEFERQMRRLSITDEWSITMRDQVQELRDAGVAIACLPLVNDEP
jgi:hypothetical protein